MKLIYRNKARINLFNLLFYVNIIKIKVAVITVKLIETPNKPWLLKSCKIAAEADSVTVAYTGTATVFTTYWMDGGENVGSPREFVVEVPEKYDVSVVSVVVNFILPKTDVGVSTPVCVVVITLGGL